MFPKIILVGPDSAADTVLEQKPLASEGRDEAWLRDFLLAHPGALPAAAIDPAFADLVPICRELPTRAGPVDAVFANRQGALVLVECKLWRNPQARREVVGQILDYAKEIARWRYEDLQREVSRARGEPGVNALFQAVAARYPDLREATFCDQVSRNLSAGRFLLLVVGDGIREGTEGIVQFVARHSGLHFTFGLVEVVGYALPSGQLLVQPRLLARTINVERAVVRVENATDAIATEILDPEISDTTPDSGANGGEGQERRRFDPALLEADRTFWQRFVERLKLDDPSQAPPRRGFGRVYLDLGVEYGWMTAYSARSANRIGTTAVFKGEAGRRLYEALERERDEIDDELSAVASSAIIAWSRTSELAWIDLHRSSPGTWSLALEQENMAWLLSATNALVNAVRPRVQRLARTLG
jgi:hypothetical protein